jgi:nucleoside-diphosphate-sugar epimerase
MSLRTPIVVMGGTGFLGRQILTELAGRGIPGNQLICVSREPRKLPVDCIMVHGDRDNPALISELADRKPGSWFDLALFRPDQMEVLQTRINSKANPCRVVIAGSVAEYGMESPLPPRVPESYAGSPSSPYGRNKLAAWKLAERSSIDLAWAVLPQLWGPFDRHGRDAVVIRELLAGRQIILRGNGRTLMPDGFVGTVAAALVHLAGLPGTGAQRFNVAGLHTITPYRFLQWTANALGTRLQTCHIPHHHWGSLEKRCNRPLRFPFSDADLSLDTSYLEETGFVPPVSARQGIEITALWHARMNSIVGPAFEPPPNALVEQPEVSPR